MNSFIKSFARHLAVVLLTGFACGVFCLNVVSASDVATTTTATTTPTAQVDNSSHYFCSKIGACLYVTMPAYLNSDSSSTLEIWSTSGNEWSIFTVFENPDFSFDFSKVTPVTVNVFGSERNAEEIATGSTTDATVYRLFTDYVEGSSTVKVLITSNESVLENGQLMTMLAGENPASTTVSVSVVAAPVIATTTTVTHLSYLSVLMMWPVALILAILLFGIILSIFMIIHHYRKNKKVQNVPSIQSVPSTPGIQSIPNNPSNPNSQNIQNNQINPTP